MSRAATPEERLLHPGIPAEALQRAIAAAVEARVVGAPSTLSPPAPAQRAQVGGALTPCFSLHAGRCC